MIHSTSLISDEVVIQARRLFRENPELHYRKVAEDLSVPILKLENAVRGKTFRHLNDKEPPVIRSVKKEEQKQKATALYKQGLSYNAIKIELDVSKSSLSLWLRDIPKPEKIKPEIVEETPVLKTEVVKEQPVKKPRKPEVGIPALAPYEGYKLYKYVEKDGLCRVQLSKPGSKQILSYGRYLMAVHLGRVIAPNERVIHREGKEDVIENLILLTNEEFTQYCKEKRQVPCVVCNNSFVPRRTVVKTCSRKCTREYQLIRMGQARQQVVHTCTECGSEFKSASNKPKTCSHECLIKRKIKLRNEKKPPRIPKEPKPPKVRIAASKSNIPSNGKRYHNECVVCEQMFYTSLKLKEVCYNPDCKDIIDNFEG